jgi:hypothetical protein
MEPVDKRKLDREIKPTGAAENQESPTEQEVEKVEEKSEPSEAEKPKFGRRRRRASSSGVLTPSS